MKFLFDLDETLYMGDLIKKAAEILWEEEGEYCFIDGSQVREFKTMEGVPERVKKKAIELFADPNWAATYKRPIPGVYAMLYTLKNKGHSIGTLTSRPAPTHEATIDVIKRDFPDIKFDAILFANHSCGHDYNVSKSDIINDYSPDVYFDDYIYYCNEALGSGVKEVYLISNKHTGWNHEVHGHIVDPRIKRIRSVLHYDIRSINGSEDQK